MTERRRLERYLNEEIDNHFKETRFRNHEDDALKHVCHTIYWICALDEHHRKATGSAYEALRGADPEGQYINGVRYARNRATHQFPQLLKVVGGAVLPFPLPAPFFEITWKPAAELPPPDPQAAKSNAALELSYRRLLEGCPVRFALNAVSAFFAKVP